MTTSPPQPPQNPYPGQPGGYGPPPEQFPQYAQGQPQPHGQPQPGTQPGGQPQQAPYAQQPFPQQPQHQRQFPQVVDCASSEAEYKVVGKLDNTVDDSKCDQFQGYEAAYTSEVGSQKYTLCLGPV